MRLRRKRPRSGGQAVRNEHIGFTIVLPETFLPILTLLQQGLILSMVPQTVYALALAVRALLPGNSDEAANGNAQPNGSMPAHAALYQPDTREVTNWRTEAMDALEPKPVVAMAALFKAERPFVTRCVKLNNYWCIKSARWNGELATDTEGHVGFVSADHGADAAANLLRRYYMEYKRKSALDIVRRWAPAECNVATGIGGVAMLAVRGIGGTVRAQYLASRKRRGQIRSGRAVYGEGQPGRQARSGFHGDLAGAEDAPVPGAEHRRRHGREAETRQAAGAACRGPPQTGPRAGSDRLGSPETCAQGAGGGCLPVGRAAPPQLCRPDGRGPGFGTGR
ncbi:hypothetical protein ACFQY9_19680 [Microvirga aerilata]|uniref:hypothetical protein n=1 Tax=Microvirga aerilata TaxID=670292 RepID=UPI0036276D7F